MQMSAETTGAASGASLSRTVTFGATDTNRLATIADLLTSLPSEERRNLIDRLPDDERLAVTELILAGRLS
jgi:hypothetical protein